MILIAESEQAGVRPGQSAAEENRAGHRALHNQCEWVFILYIYTATGFLLHHSVLCFEFLTSSCGLTVTSSDHAMIRNASTRVEESLRQTVVRPP